MDRRERRRPNWPLIYAAEIDVYGRTFRHDGAPEPQQVGATGGWKVTGDATFPAQRNHCRHCERAHLRWG